MKKNTAIKTVQKTINNDPRRFVMIDTETGEILDDAQGYGYKSPQKAYAAYHYKSGGKKKYDAAQNYWKNHPEIRQFCQRFFEMNCKEFARGEVAEKDIQAAIKEEFNEDVPINFIKKL